VQKTELVREIQQWKVGPAAEQICKAACSKVVIKARARAWVRLGSPSRPLPTCYRAVAAKSSVWEQATRQKSALWCPLIHPNVLLIQSQWCSSSESARKRLRAGYKTGLSRVTIDRISICPCVCYQIEAWATRLVSEKKNTNKKSVYNFWVNCGSGKIL